MNNLALFDLDHTLLPIDSDYEWGQFLVRIGASTRPPSPRRNDEFFAQYQAGTLDPVEYLEFALGTLARFRAGTGRLHAQFMREVILPAIRRSARRCCASTRTRATWWPSSPPPTASSPRRSRGASASST
jgi:phosphoserine phosphatase